MARTLKHSRGGGGRRHQLRPGLFLPLGQGRVVLQQVHFAHHGEFYMALSNLLGRFAQEDMFHAPAAERPPQRDVNVVGCAHEADHLQALRQQSPDVGERVRAHIIDAIDGQGALEQPLIGFPGGQTGQDGLGRP